MSKAPSEYFIKPHYMRKGKEGYDQRFWASTMQRALDLGEPAIALEAEMLRQWYEAGGKTVPNVPFEFTNDELFQFGVTRKNKRNYLLKLETSGWISVQWRDRNEPIIQLLKPF